MDVSKFFASRLLVFTKFFIDKLIALQVIPDIDDKATRLVDLHAKQIKFKKRKY